MTATNADLLQEQMNRPHVVVDDVCDLDQWNKFTWNSSADGVDDELRWTTFVVLDELPELLIDRLVRLG